MITEDTSRNKGAVTTGILAAIAASSCCIPPVIAAIAGVGGMGTTLSWMEPFRPYLIGLAIVAIGYAWYAHLKPKQADDCGCDIEKPKWYQTKSFLIGMTLFAAVSISFPYYSGVFFSDNNNGKSMVVQENNVSQAVLSIEGMTCAGCEHHVNATLNNSFGVVEASSSFETGIATVKFDKSKVSIDELAKTVKKETGYKVTDKKISE